jgi:hypothetical protein
MKTQALTVIEIETFTLSTSIAPDERRQPVSHHGGDYPSKPETRPFCRPYRGPRTDQRGPRETLSSRLNGNSRKRKPHEKLTISHEAGLSMLQSDTRLERCWPVFFGSCRAGIDPLLPFKVNPVNAR